MNVASGTLLTLLATILLGGCLPSLPAGPVLTPGTFRVETDIRFQFNRRDFLLHVPKGYSEGNQLPLVVVLHGAFSTAEQTELETGFSDLADEENFLVAYPEGIGLFGYLQHWNAGHCCGKAANDGIDDVTFVDEVIQAVARKARVDPRRIYLAGMSNGGMLVHRFAAERGGLIAAAAVISGALGSSVADTSNWNIPPPENPPSMLLIHGDADQHVPLEGGASRLSGREKRSYLSLAEAGRFWRNASTCDDAVEIESLRDDFVMRRSWTGCAAGKRVEIIELKGWGHQWPGLYFTRQRPDADPLHNFDGTRMVWDFFKHQTTAP